jgi:hypothetical protein
MKLARRLLLASIISCALITAAAAQDIAPPTPQKLVVHSSILNEDRVIWVRTPIEAKIAIRFSTSPTRRVQSTRSGPSSISLSTTMRCRL